MLKTIFTAFVSGAKKISPNVVASSQKPDESSYTPVLCLKGVTPEMFNNFLADTLKPGGPPVDYVKMALYLCGLVPEEESLFDRIHEWEPWYRAFRECAIALELGDINAEVCSSREGLAPAELPALQPESLYNFCCGGLQTGAPAIDQDITLLFFPSNDLNAEQISAARQSIYKWKSWFEFRFSIDSADPNLIEEEPDSGFSCMARLVREFIRFRLKKDGPEVNYGIVSSYIDKQYDAQNAAKILRLILTYWNWYEAFIEMMSISKVEADPTISTT